MLFEFWFENLYLKSGFLDAVDHLAHDRSVWLNGVWGSARGFVAAALAQRLRRPMVLVFQDETAAFEAYENLRFFLQGFEELGGHHRQSRFTVKYPPVLDPGEDPLVFLPAAEYTHLDAVNREHGKNIERLLFLRRLAAGEPLIVVTSLDAALQKYPPPEALVGLELSLHTGRDYSMQQMIQTLLDLGYRRETMVEEPGQFSVRGGIVDIAAPNADYPLSTVMTGLTVLM